jgi:hypothetical protein
MPPFDEPISFALSENSPWPRDLKAEPAHCIGS